MGGLAYYAGRLPASAEGFGLYLKWGFAELVGCRVNLSSLHGGIPDTLFFCWSNHPNKKKTTYPKYSVQSLYIWSVYVLTINIKLSIQASTVLSVQVIVVRVDY